MRKIVLLTALLASPGAFAADGLHLGVGVDYSTGTYGTDTTTRILAVPVVAAWVSGNWTFKGSLPWVSVDGDPSVVPGLGGVINAPGATPGTERVTSTGLGDLELAATYHVPTTGSFGLSLTGAAKIATADEAKGLGTGSNDYSVAAEAYQTFDAVTVFGGAGYTWLGDSPYIDIDGAAHASLGASVQAGAGEVGLTYGWREALTSFDESRREVGGFISMPTGDAGKFQLYASKGLTDGSPDWSAGASYVRAF